MSDTTLQAIDVRCLPVEDGAEHAVVAVMTGLGTPFGGPNGQPVILPLDIYRIPVTKGAVKELIDSLQEAYEKLPDPKPQSNLVVPGNPNDVDKIANDLRKFTK